MAGATQVEMTKPNPSDDHDSWLSNKAWLSFLEMSSSFKQFANFDDEFIKNVHEWEKVYNSAAPEAMTTVWPGKW